MLEAVCPDEGDTIGRYALAVVAYSIIALVVLLSMRS